MGCKSRNVWRTLALRGNARWMRYNGAQGALKESDLLIIFNANTTPFIAQQLVRAIQFKTVRGAAGQRNVVFTVSDGYGRVSTVVSKMVT